MTSKDTNKREEAAKALAAKIMNRMERSHWEVNAPLLRDPHNGRVLPEADQLCETLLPPCDDRAAR